jgi:hypothetical protein
MNIFFDFAGMIAGSFIGNYGSTLFYKKKNLINENPFQLRLDLSEPDKNTFYSIQDAVKKHSLIEINLVCGTCRCNPDFALNWYYALMERPKNCHVTLRLNSNAKEGAMAIAVACDQIIPRHGSWYEITSVEAATEDVGEFEFGSRPRQTATFSNLKLLHRVLGQYLEIPCSLDKKTPMASLGELGLPVTEISKEAYRTPIEVA